VKYKLGDKVQRIDGPYKGEMMTIVDISKREYRVRSSDPTIGDLTYRDDDLIPFHNNGVILFMETL
jgi:hypothetical protein